MKISKLFHWLYAIIMLLPIVVIPVFAIYSHRHTIDSYSVQVPQNEIVDFNQLAIQEIDVPLYHFVNNDTFVVNHSVSDTSVFNGGNYKICDIIGGHKYYLNIDSDFNSPLVFNFYTGVNYSNGSRIVSYSDNWLFTLGYSSNISAGTYHCYVNIVDLTQMFGSGNEPTKEQFESWYPRKYYSYTLGRTELVKNFDTITYDDTDIGSQMLYSFYNTTDKYFALNKLFGLGGLYDWFLLNMFGGNCPLGFTIFWNLLTYWLIISIFWLLFDVMIYVPQLVHRWLDKGVIE